MTAAGSDLSYQLKKKAGSVSNGNMVKHVIRLQVEEGKLNENGTVMNCSRHRDGMLMFYFDKVVGTNVKGNQLHSQSKVILKELGGEGGLCHIGSFVRSP